MLKHLFVYIGLKLFSATNGIVDNLNLLFYQFNICLQFFYFAV